MIQLRRNNSGASLIGILVFLIVIFMAVMMGLRYKNFIHLEAIENKIDYGLYTRVHNTIQEVYSYDWGRCILKDPEETKLEDRYSWQQEEFLKELRDLELDFKVLVEGDGRIEIDYGQIDFKASGSKDPDSKASFGPTALVPIKFSYRDQGFPKRNRELEIVLEKALVVDYWTVLD